MSLRTNEIAFKFHGGGQIMAGIIKAEPWRRSCKTPGYTYICISFVDPSLSSAKLTSVVHH